MASIRKTLGWLLAATMFWISLPASAQHLQIWNGSAWVNTGTVTYTGSVQLTYLGITLPCSSTWVLTISGGVGSVASMTKSGSSACTGSSASNLLWPVSDNSYTGLNPPFSGAPTLTAPLYSIRITGVRIYVPAPLSVFCPSSTTSGTINGVMDSTGRIVFKATLGPCSFQTQRDSWLTPDRPVRVVF